MKTIMYIFRIQKLNASDVCCLFWKKKETKKKRDNKQRIKYFLSSSECLAYCRICFAATTISFIFFVITGGVSRGVRPFISVSGTSYAHISGSALPCSTPPRLHRPLRQAGLSSFLQPRSASGSGSFLTAVCVAEAPSPHQCLEHLRRTSVRTGFTPLLWHPTWNHSFVRVAFTLALQTPFPLDLSVKNTWPLCWCSQYFAVVLKWIFQASVLNLRTYFTWLPTF